MQMMLFPRMIGPSKPYRSARFDFGGLNKPDLRPTRPLRVLVVACCLLHSVERSGCTATVIIK